MTETYGIFDSADGDARTYAASVLCGILAKLLRDGVVHGDGGELAVSASDPPAMSVSVSTGTALLRGRYYQNDAALSLAIAADPSNPRIDRVVLRLNATPGRTIRAVVLKGTPAPAPVAPALTRTAETWELSLAQVRVEAGATSIGSSKITDERGDADLCGDAAPAWVPSSQISIIGDLIAEGHQITGLGAPSSSTEAATKSYVDDRTVPSGTISIWYGSAASVPAGWHICDGSSGTPDLRDRFVVGAGGAYAQGAIGGEAEHTLTIDEMPLHSHVISDNWKGSSFQKSPVQDTWDKSDWEYPSTKITGPAGGGQPHNNLPPYKALYYIMKL